MNSSFLYALAGGALIGLSATLYLLFQGRVAGISGILGAAIDGRLPTRARVDRLWFLAGLFAAGVPLFSLRPELFQRTSGVSPGLVVVAGLLVGVGTRLGSGCTSGHGVCGISRGSSRSLVATLTFITTGAIAVVVLRALGGWS